jgi:rSAM/selenodomain-associated transferase 2
MLSTLSTPRLSVVIPCVDEAETIAGTLAAIEPLRARGAEVIVVDGGSVDATVARAQGRADRVLTAARGRASQMNAGAKHARGEVLLFLHADTRLPQHADMLIESGLASSGKAWGRFDVTIEGTHPLLRVIAAAMNRRSRYTGVATGDQGIFVSRTLFERVGGYPSIALMEDIALTTALKRHGAPLCIPEKAATSGRRWEKHGVVRTMLLMWRLRLAYRLGADPDRLALHYAAHR